VPIERGSAEVERPGDRLVSKRQVRIEMLESGRHVRRAEGQRDSSRDTEPSVISIALMAIGRPGPVRRLRWVSRRTRAARFQRPSGSRATTRRGRSSVRRRIIVPLLTSSRTLVADGYSIDRDQRAVPARQADVVKLDSAKKGSTEAANGQGCREVAISLADDQRPNLVA
jgi:hypothetical protein